MIAVSFIPNDIMVRRRLKPNATLECDGLPVKLGSQLTGNGKPRNYFEIWECHGMFNPGLEYARADL